MQCPDLVHIGWCSNWFSYYYYFQDIYLIYKDQFRMKLSLNALISYFSGYSVLQLSSSLVLRQQSGAECSHGTFALGLLSTYWHCLQQSWGSWRSSPSFRLLALAGTAQKLCWWTSQLFWSYCLALLLFCMSPLQCTTSPRRGIQQCTSPEPLMQPHLFQICSWCILVRVRTKSNQILSARIIET